MAKSRPGLQHFIQPISFGKRVSRRLVNTPSQGRESNVWGQENASSNRAPTIDVSNIRISESVLKVLTVNIRGIECYGRLDQVQLLLVKHLVSVAALTETETSHSIAQTTHVKGFKAFCPPSSVTGPQSKEVGVILMIDDSLASDCKPRPEINGTDTVQTVWIELTKYNLIIGGIYRRARASADLEKAEFAQLSRQILKAAGTGKKILVLGDTNIDHTNPNHKKAKEAKDLLSDLEAANIQRLISHAPTWKSYGLHKVCSCPVGSQQVKNSPNYIGHSACGCLKRHLTSTIDNAYLSISETASLQVLEDAISDHYPILVNLFNKGGA